MPGGSSAETERTLVPGDVTEPLTNQPFHCDASDFSLYRKIPFSTLLRQLIEAFLLFSAGSPKGHTKNIEVACSLIFF